MSLRQCGSIGDNREGEECLSDSVARSVVSGRVKNVSQTNILFYCIDNYIFFTYHLLYVYISH